MTLEQHKAEELKQRDIHIANANACAGAIAMLDRLIEERDALPTEAPAAEPAT